MALCVDKVFISKKNTAKKDTLLVVRVDAIGDFFLWMQGARELRSLYPRHKIVLIANHTWAEAAAAFPYWDEVWALNPNKFLYNWLYRIKYIRKINRYGFNIAIQPTYSRVFEVGDCVVNASNAQQRIGFIGDLSNTTNYLHNIGNAYYTKLIPSLGEKMELIRNLEFIQKLAPYRINLELCEIPRLLNLGVDILPLKKYYIIFPGASWAGKCWPEENFSQIIKEITRCQDWQPILCGSLAEKEMCDRIISMSQIEGVENYAGRTSLLELIELIRGAELLISNDTSAIHIAPLVKTKSICIVGGGHYGRFLPYPDQLNALKPVVETFKLPCFQCNWNCTIEREKRYPVPCISGVGVNQVINGIKSLLL